VYAPGVPSANAAGFTTVSALMADANAALLGTDRTLQGRIKDALDAANNNATFVQAEACEYTFETQALAPSSLAAPSQ
jgi:hypothetical protein